MSAFLLTPLILIFVILYVAYPLLREEAEPRPDVDAAEWEQALALKDEIISALKDIEMDYQMGKLSDDDYQRLKADFETRAVGALQELEALEAARSPRRPGSRQANA